MSFDTPNPPFNASDFLLIELVPLVARTSSELAVKDEQWSKGLNNDTSKRDNGSASENAGDASGSVIGLDEDEARETFHHRLETLGYRVGLGIAERCV